jgi:hypothetical protein
MKLQLTNTILTYICREIDSGRPLSALLRASEYLPSESPLWMALTTKAKTKLSKPHYAEAQDAIAKVLKGATLAALSPAEQAQLKSIREQSSSRVYVVPQMPYRQVMQAAPARRVRGSRRFSGL